MLASLWIGDAQWRGDRRLCGGIAGYVIRHEQGAPEPDQSETVHAPMMPQRAAFGYAGRCGWAFSRSGQGLQRRRRKALQGCELAVVDFRSPLRVGEQGPADGDQVEFLAIEPAQQLIEAGWGGTLARECGEKFPGETD